MARVTTVIIDEHVKAIAIGNRLFLSVDVLKEEVKSAHTIMGWADTWLRRQIVDLIEHVEQKVK